MNTKLEAVDFSSRFEMVHCICIQRIDDTIPYCHVTWRIILLINLTARTLIAMLLSFKIETSNNLFSIWVVKSCYGEIMTVYLIGKFSGICM